MTDPTHGALAPEVVAAALESGPDALVVYDGELRVVRANAAAHRLEVGALGHLCSADEAVPRSACPRCQREEVLRDGGTRRWYVAIPGTDEAAAKQYLELTLQPLRDERGRIAGVLELARDATPVLGLEHFLIGEAERLEAEVARLDREAAQLRDRGDTLRRELVGLRESQAEILYKDRMMTLGQLVAGVAHDLHTPLGALLASVDLLRRGFGRLAGRAAAGGTTLERLTDHLDVLDEAARRIETTVASLRTFARVDDGPFQPVDVHEGIDSTLTLLRHLCGQRIAIVRDYGRLPPVSCQPDAVNQVFLNLLLNAVQAIPGAGTIRVATRRVDDRVEIEVADDGVGISPESQARVFEPGYTTKGRGVGTGIGLPICRRVVEDHGGTIALDSRPGAGTRVLVRLPVSPAATAAAEDDR